MKRWLGTTVTVVFLALLVVSSLPSTSHAQQPASCGVISSIASGNLLGAIGIRPTYEAIFCEANLNFWKFFRSFLNYVIVAVLIAAAFAGTLRINVEAYTLKRILPGVIFGSIMGNISIYLCGLILNISESIYRTTTSLLYNSLDASTVFFTALKTAFITLGGLFAVGSAVPAGAGAAGAAVAVGPVAAVALIAGVFFVIVLVILPLLLFFILLSLQVIRYFVIQFLVGISPIAFIALGIPILRPIWQRWWKQFSLWAFLKPVSYFFILLAVVVLKTGVGGFFISYIVAIVSLALAIIVPFQSGGWITTAVAKLGKQFGASRFNGFINRDFSNTAGRRGAVLRGAQAAIATATNAAQVMKDKEERRGREAKAKGYGIAATTIDAKTQLAQQVLRGEPGGRALLGLATPESAGIRPSNHMQKAQNKLDAEVAKELSDDMAELMGDAAYSENDNIRAGSVMKLAEKGLLKEYMEKMEELINKAQAEGKTKLADDLRLRSGLAAGANLIGDGKDFRDSDIVQRFLAAHLGTRQEQENIRATGNASAIAGNRNAVQRLGKISETLFHEGNDHLGHMAKTNIGEAPTISINRVDRDQSLQERVLKTREPQKLAMTLSLDSMLRPEHTDTTPAYQDSFLQLASTQDFIEVKSQLNRGKPAVRNELRRMALAIPNHAGTNRPSRRLDGRAISNNPTDRTYAEDTAYADFITFLREPSK